MKRQSARVRTHQSTYTSFLESLEDRFALDATSWPTFGGNAQHTSNSSITSQALEAVHWSAPVDNFPTSRAAHYGGPLITQNNTVIYPYKVGTTTTPDFHIMARNGNDGTLLWDETTDWVPSNWNWYPAHQPVYVPSTNRVYFAGANGSLYYKDNVDTPSGVPTKVQINVFGTTGNVASTALTADNAGNIYYGYRNGSVGGFVKVTPAGGITIVTANDASQDPGVTDWIPQANHAPAISNDGLTLYTTIRRASTSVYGRLIGLSTANLTTQYNSGLLKDPRNGAINNASITNDSTSSPMVAPDGHVYLGVQGSPYNGSRGWMLHFNGTLTTQFTPGGFGWDTTPSVVPASMVPQYTGSSSYLIFTKYNNYYGTTNGGDGSNAIAVLDPNDSEVEYHADSAGQLVMKRVLYKVAPTPDWDYPTIPTAVREWCINYGAVDPSTQSIIVNNADGKFYRWHLPTDTLIEPVQLTSGIGQPYTMTVIGVDGTLYGIQIGTLFAIGQTPRLSLSDAAFAEGTGGSTTATFTVSLNFPRTQAITVNYDTANGTATAGSDYTSASGVLTFNPGEKTKTISVTVGTDSLYELDETFFVNLSNVSNAIILDGQGQGTINNDDAQPSLSIDDLSVNEGNSGTTQFNFTVTLSAVSGLTTNVSYATSNGTANGGDYSSTSGSLTFTPGQTSKTVTVLVNGDTQFESNDTFFVNLSGAVNSSITDSQGIGTIVNDDNVPSLGIADASANEGGSLTFVVTLSNSSAEIVTVNYSTANDSATAGFDFTGSSDTLTFNPGELSKSIIIACADDALDEVHETFFVNLSGTVNAFLTDNQAIGTIYDDDPSAIVSIGDMSQNEGDSGTTAFTFFVSLNTPSGRVVKVNYATADGTATTANSDYQSTSGKVTFLPGETVKPVTIFVNGDSNEETNETFLVNLSGPAGGQLGDDQGVGMIINDDGLRVDVGDATGVEGNVGTTTFSFTVNLSSVSPITVMVDYATANGTATAAAGDYVSGSGTLTFLSGETSKTISVLVNGDLLNELNETFFINLSNPVGGAIGDGQGQGTIQNDDPLPSISVDDVNVPELDYNTGTVTVYVMLSSPSGQTVQVDYDTSNGTASSTVNKDYTDTFGTLTFLPGQTVASFDVAIVGDTRDEPDETIRVNLFGPVNATIADNLGIITIIDDDVVYVTISGTSVVEGNSGQSFASVTVDLSVPADYEITIDFETEDYGAIAGSDYVSTSGTLTFGPGILSQTILIPIIGDLLDESDEDFEVVLSNATPGVELGIYPEADVDIIDDDTAGFLISDVTVGEGNSGTVLATFTVSLTNSSDHTVGVNYATADNTALSPSDYQATSGSLSFAPGVTSQTVSVLVNGDTITEPNETFFVNLSLPTGDAVISDAQGIGTIANDDSVSLSINDVAQAELQGGVKGFVFIVTLSSPSSQTVTVQYATADGTATVAGIDYFATSGTLTFFAGQTTKVINVQVKGDKIIEPNEIFHVNLFNATNTTIFDSQGVGTIINDDGDFSSVVAPVDPPTPTPKPRGKRNAFEDVVPTGGTSKLTEAAFASTSRSKGNVDTERSENLAKKAGFADLRFYVLEAGQLQSVNAKNVGDDFAYSIDASSVVSHAAHRSWN